MDNITVVYELDPLSLPKSARYELYKKRVINSDEGLTYFKQAGVYTWQEGVFFVLPWVTKKLDRSDFLKIHGKSSNDSTTLLLDTFFWLKDILKNVPQKKMNVDTGRDFLYFAFLRALEKNLYNGLKNNVFRNRVDVVNVIKGRWLIQEDIKRTEHPTKFTCDLNECDKNHPVLSLAREYCDQLKKVCASGKLRQKASLLERELANFVELPEDLESTMRGAHALAKADRRFKEWIPWIECLKWVFHKNDKQKRPALANSGVVADVIFPSAEFFSTSIFKIIQSMGFTAQEFPDAPFLGGGQWCSIRGRTLPDTHTDMNEKQNPNLLVTSGANRSVFVRCSYKNYDLMKTSQGIPVVRDFNYYERVQIFSHLIMTSTKINFDSEFIFVFFPCVDNQIDKLPILRINCQLENGDINKIVWSEKLQKGNNLRIIFYPIDVMAALAELQNGRPEHNSELERIERLLTLSSRRELEVAI